MYEANIRNHNTTIITLEPSFGERSNPVTMIECGRHVFHNFTTQTPINVRLSEECPPAYEEFQGCCVCTKRPKTPDDYLCELVSSIEMVSSAASPQFKVVHSNELLDSTDSPQSRLRPPPNTPEGLSYRRKEPARDIHPEFRERVERREQEYKDLFSSGPSLKEFTGLSTGNPSSPNTREAFLINSDEDLDPGYQTAWSNRVYRDLHSSSLRLKENIDPFASSLGPRYREREAWKEREFRDLCSGRLSLREYRDHLVSDLGPSFWSIVDIGASLLEMVYP